MTMINKHLPVYSGTQPSRVLQFNITAQFENTTPDFLAKTEAMIKVRGLNPGIKYYLNEEAILEKIGNHVQTPFVDDKKTIHFHETFASYVWIISYCLVVLYDEAMAKPAQNLFYGEERNKVDVERIKKAENLFYYGISLIQVFTEWDKDNLPNPEYYNETEDFYIGRINGIYVYAVNYILCHEFVHVEQGHIDTKLSSKVTGETLIGFEEEADSKAIEYILEGVPPEKRRTAITGILAGLCCMLYFRASTRGRSHPDVDKRIHAFLERIKCDEDDPIWGVAALAYRLWDAQFGKGFTYPCEVLNLKELYENVRAQVEEENGKAKQAK